MKMKRQFEGIWIPKEIWLSHELTLQEKIFFVEIKSLDNESGCFAGNEYFSSFFGLSKSRCTQIINSLVEKGFVTSVLEKQNGSVSKRILKVDSRFNILNRTVQFSKSSGLENCEYNNTSINNTSIKDTNVIDFDKLLSMINILLKRDFRVINDKAKRGYKSLLKSGYTKTDIINAIKNAKEDPFHLENNGKYLNPEYFSRSRTIDLYGFKPIQKTEKEIIKEGGHRNF